MRRSSQLTSTMLVTVAALAGCEAPIPSAPPAPVTKVAGKQLVTFHVPGMCEKLKLL